MLENERVYVQAFADDVVLVFSGETALEVAANANPVLARVLDWGAENKLRFAPHKTNAMLVTRKLIFDTPRLSMGGTEVRMAEAIKVLGLTIDKGLTFNAHVTTACAKAIKRYKQLSRAARVSWGLNPEVIEIIYKAVIEPTILYAAPAWAPAANKLGITKRLGTIQRGFAIKKIKAYRTVSLTSALVLSGMIPLGLRVREVASLYEAKRGLPHPALGDREIERAVPVSADCHPAEKTRLEFGMIDGEGGEDESASYDVRIFTDGSKIDGKVGAALSLWNGAVETKTVKLALASYCTVYQAELLALSKAVEMAAELAAPVVGIFSDSRSALQAVTLGSLHPLAAETARILRLCAKNNKEIKLSWIKAHRGLEGNERADVLAKEAALGSKRRPNYDLCPVSHVKRCIRDATIDVWDEEYIKSATGSTTKLFFPNARVAYKIMKKIDINYETTQLLTGHGGFSEYLHRFKCKEDPSCHCEQGAQETVPHLLLECPIYAKERMELEHRLDIEVRAGSIPDIMKNKKTRGIFIEFGVELVRRTNKRNATARDGEAT